jgi:hypothetical protein
MPAQTPTATVHDYLKEVRIFASGSPEFAQIAASLGVDATLHTLGPGASLAVAIRNDSGQAVEMRVLFEMTKGGKTTPRDLEISRFLAARRGNACRPTGDQRCAGADDECR